MGCNINGETGFAHAGPCANQDKLTTMQPCQQIIQQGKAGGYAGNTPFVAGQLFHNQVGAVDNFTDVRKPLAACTLHDNVEDGFFCVQQYIL